VALVPESWTESTNSGPANDLPRVLDRYRAAGFDAVTVNVGDSHETLEHVIATIASYRRQIAEHPERYRLVQDARDLRRDARLAVAFDVEGALSIGDRLDLDIGPARRLGLRGVRMWRGPHVWQRPLDAWEQPDLTVRSLTELSIRLAAAASP